MKPLRYWVRVLALGTVLGLLLYVGYLAWGVLP